MTLAQQISAIDQKKAEWIDWLQANSVFAYNTVEKVKRATEAGSKETFTADEMTLLRDGFVFAMSCLAVDVRIKEEMK
jgi:hypothetical protein